MWSTGFLQQYLVTNRKPKSCSFHVWHFARKPLFTGVFQIGDMFVVPSSEEFCRTWDCNLCTYYISVLISPEFLFRFQARCIMLRRTGYLLIFHTCNTMRVKMMKSTCPDITTLHSIDLLPRHWLILCGWNSLIQTNFIVPSEKAEPENYCVRP